MNVKQFTSEKVNLINKKCYLISKYILQCFAMQSSLEDIKITHLYKKEIKYHVNKLLELLKKESNTTLHINVFNIEEQDIVFSSINALEDVSSKIAKLSITETIMVDRFLNDVLAGKVPKKYQTIIIDNLREK